MTSLILKQFRICTISLKKNDKKHHELHFLMEAQVKDIIARVLNVDADMITDDLSSGDIPEWDSVGNLAIISTIEQELEIEFPLEDLFDLTSVRSLVDEVNLLKND